MAYKKLTFERVEASKLVISRLKRFGLSFKYADAVSLEAFEAAVEAENRATAKKNAQLDLVDAATQEVNAASATTEKTLAALRVCIGAAEGRDSDAYVAAGGIRQSDIVAQQKATKEENRKATEGKKKAEVENAM